VALELRKRVFELLTSNPDKKFKAREIATWICETYSQEAERSPRSSQSLLSSTAQIVPKHLKTDKLNRTHQ